jgi:capsular polysaccharide biosynthesis protein
VLERFPELDRLPVLVSPRLPRSMVGFYAMLGLDPARLRRLPAHEPVRARRLWLPSLTHRYQLTSPMHVDFLRRRLAGPLGEGLGRPRRRLFLSRRNAGYRALLNEAEVLATLAAFGVEPLVPEDFSMAEQIALFASAELVVSPIGGASAAILFAAPGAACVELTHDHCLLPQYGILSGLLGQRYARVVGRPHGNRGPLTFDQDFTICVDALAATVRTLLDGGPPGEAP